MRKKLYGCLNNRFDEGKNYTGRDIQAGDDITMYYWSDRHPYYITRVVDQKHIFVKPYEVCGDRSKDGGMGHQDWLYFKTKKEHNKYLNDWFESHPEEQYSNYSRLEDNPKEADEEEWVLRYNKWKEVSRWTKQKIGTDENGKCIEYPFNFTDKDIEKIENGEEVIKYISLEPISFGVREYYYDWSF